MQTGKSNQDKYSDQRYNGFKNAGEQCDDRNAPETSRLPKTGSGFWESGGSERRVDCGRPLRYWFVKAAKLAGSLWGQKLLVISEDVALTRC